MTSESLTWKHLVKEEITRLCHAMGSRTFTRQELLTFSGQVFQAFGEGKTPFQTVSRVLQELHKQEAFLAFDDDRRGHYTLQVDFLEGELDVEAQAVVLAQPPAKREYWVETFTRNNRWVKQAKAVLGTQCLCEGCANTFTKANGEPYIEVHHIVPLREGGEDALWNLSVLCAHHHKMAHFAASAVQQRMAQHLLRIVEVKLKTA
jgi:hypothetical protein